MSELAAQRLQEIIEEHSGLEGALLPILHTIQNEVGYLPADAVPTISRALKISRAEIQGVISFYHDFKEEPPAQHRVELCRAESCQALGGRALENKLRERLGVGTGERTPDGKVSLEAVYCFGNCACSPAIRIDHRLYGRVDAEQLDRLLEDLV